MTQIQTGSGRNRTSPGPGNPPSPREPSSGLQRARIQSLPPTGLPEALEVSSPPIRITVHLAAGGSPQVHLVLIVPQFKTLHNPFELPFPYLSGGEDDHSRLPMLA